MDRMRRSMPCSGRYTRFDMYLGMRFDFRLDMHFGMRFDFRLDMHFGMGFDMR